MTETSLVNRKEAKKKAVKKKLKLKLRKVKEKAKRKLTRLRLNFKIKICPKCGRQAYVAGTCLSCHFKGRRRIKIEKLLEKTFNKELAKLNKLDK